MKSVITYLAIVCSVVVARNKTFITDDCRRDSDCVSGCCGFSSGLCAGPIIAIERDRACGFGNFVSNCNAAKLLGFKNVTACRNRRIPRV